MMLMGSVRVRGTVTCRWQWRTVTERCLRVGQLVNGSLIAGDRAGVYNLAISKKEN